MTVSTRCIRRALERVEQSYTDTEAAGGTPVAGSTLRTFYDNRRGLYFYAEAKDERLQAAAQEHEPLEKSDIPDDTNFPEQEIIQILRTECVPMGLQVAQLPL